MLGGLFGGASTPAELEELLAERDAEIQGLQEIIKAHQQADQRDFLNDNSDHLAEVIQIKNQVILQLQAQLSEQGQDGLAQAVANAATSSAEVERLRVALEAQRRQLEESERAGQLVSEQLVQVIADRDANAEAARKAVAEAEASAAHAVPPATSAQLQELQAAVADRDARLQAQSQQLRAAQAAATAAQASLAAQAAARGAPPPPEDRPSGTELAQMQSQLLQMQAAVADRDARLQALGQQLQASQAAASAAQASLAAQAASNAPPGQGPQIEELHAALAQRDEHMRNLDGQLRELREALTQREERMHTLEGQLQAAQQAQRDQAEAAATTAMELRCLESTVAERDAAALEQEGRFRGMVAARDEQAAIAARCTQEAAAREQAAAAELAGLRGEAAVATAAAQAARESRDAIVAEVAGLRASLAEQETALEMAAAAAAAEVEKSTADLCAVQSEGVAGTGESGVAGAPQTVSSDDTAASKAIAAARKKAENLEKLNGALGKELMEAKASTMAAASRVEMLEAELAAATCRLPKPGQEDRAAELNGTMGQLAAELERTNAEAQRKQARCQELETKVQALNEALADAEGRAQALLNKETRPSKTTEQAAGAEADAAISGGKAQTMPAATQHPQQSREYGELQAEVQQLRARLEAKVREAQVEETRHVLQVQAAGKELEETKHALQEASARGTRLEAQLSRARANAAELRRSSDTAVRAESLAGPGKALEDLLRSRAGTTGLAGIIADTLNDMELGTKPSVTLSDIGLGDLQFLTPVDGFLQLLSALMAVRADARLLMFGIWILCHTIYTAYLVWEHFLKR